MARRSDPQAIFCTRLKQARLAAGLSQKQLGIRAGIDPFVASTRINRYEKGIHRADLSTVMRLAETLNVPLAYLYADDERLARMILAFSKLPRTKQESLLKNIEKKAPPGEGKR
jgi:transcriptional regulator with XRE-family HTH domain